MEIRNAEDAREYMKLADDPQGNAFLSKEQAVAISEAIDKVYELYNVHRIHPVYIVGFLESVKHDIMNETFGLMERVREMVGGK